MISKDPVRAGGYREGPCASPPGTSTRSSSAPAVCPGWMSGGRTSSACRRPSWRMTRSRSCSVTSSPIAATKLRSRRALVERGAHPLARGARDVSGALGGPGLPNPGGAGPCPPAVTGSAWSRCTSRTGASPTRTTQYELAWLRCPARGGGRRPGGRLSRRHERRADRRGRVDPEAYVGRPTLPPPSARRWRSSGARPARRVRDRWPDARVFTYWDYRAGTFHQGLGMRITDPRRRPGDEPRAGGLGGPAGPEGQRAERPRAGDRRPRRGTGRATSARWCRRPRTRSQARREEAPAVAVGAHQSRLRSRSRDGWTRSGSPGIFG